MSSNLNSTKNFTYWLSWIGVLPISLITGLLVSLPVHWILYQTLTNFVTPYPEAPEKILQPFFTSLVVVFISAKIAPQYKLKTAVIMAMLWVFGSGASFVFGYLGHKVGDIELNLTYGGAPIIMGAVGALVGLYIVKKELSIESQAESI